VFLRVFPFILAGSLLWALNISPRESSKKSYTLAPQSYSISNPFSLKNLVVDSTWGFRFSDGSEGQTLEVYLNKLPGSLSDKKKDMIGVLVVEKIIRSYLKLFTHLARSEYLPDLTHPHSFRLFSPDSSLVEIDQIVVLFPKSLEFLDLSGSLSFEDRAFQITQFLQRLQHFALKHKVNPKYFLSLLLNEASIEEKADLLSSLIVGLERVGAAKSSPESEDLLLQAGEELQETFTLFVQETMQLPHNSSKELVLAKLKELDKALNRIPNSVNRRIEVSIRVMLFELFDAPHRLVQQQSRAWFATRRQTRPGHLYRHFISDQLANTSV